MARGYSNYKGCFECGGRARHLGRPYDYKLANGTVIPMIIDAGVYQCENDDCGIIWDEHGED